MSLDPVRDSFAPAVRAAYDAAVCAVNAADAVHGAALLGKPAMLVGALPRLVAAVCPAPEAVRQAEQLLLQAGEPLRAGGRVYSCAHSGAVAEAKRVLHAALTMPGNARWIPDLDDPAGWWLDVARRAGVLTAGGDPGEQWEAYAAGFYRRAGDFAAAAVLPILRREAANVRGAVVITTDDDRYILAVLAAHKGKALTYDKIATESDRLARENRRDFRRLPDSKIRERVPVLKALGLVAKPQGTQKKGVSITADGLAALEFVRGNTTEAHRIK